MNNSNDIDYLHDYRSNNMNLFTFKLTDTSDFLVYMCKINLLSYLI